MPGWLQAFVKVNPVAHVIEATPGLMRSPAVAEPLINSVICLARLTAVFARLAVAAAALRS